MYSLPTLSRKIKAKLVRLAYDEQWMLAARPRRDSQLPVDLGGCAFLQPPMGMHYADPFVIRQDGKSYVFFESWFETHKKGRIEVACLDSLGRWSSPELALERPYHLSYPHIFSWRGGIYMLPETRHNRTIEIYRSLNFPCAWKLEAVLRENVDAVDTTLFEQSGCWWMFTAGLGETNDRLRQLSIFHSSSPFGPWQSHTKNPVVIDFRTARPAGNLFRSGNLLIRPAQDCRSRYGYAVTWNKVETLTNTTYRETRVGSLNPSFRNGYAAIHTFNQDEQWQVFDVKRLNLRTDDNFRQAA